ncbi:MAG TPA: apolipoprotein N-acyltransferase [Bryobacteraceae bacterium]|nr:apolipoprotein N-acyltransferase [Bryobacteraceae bacterium]
MLNLLLALLSAVLLIVSFPRLNLVWFAPLALTPLLIALARERRHGRRFLIGWACGAVYWCGVCYWVEIVLAVHGDMGKPVAWAMFVLFCIAKALHMGIFALLAGILMRRWWAAPAVAAWWVTVEATHGSLGFAWLALGNAGIDMGVPLRLAPYTGVYGLSFVFALMSAGLALAILRRPRRELLWLTPLFLLPLLPAMPPGVPGQDAALLVQSNISETQEWTPQTLVQTVREQAALTLRGALQPGLPRPTIIAWPEVPAPYYYEEDAGFRDYMNNLARMTQAYILFGTVAHTAKGAPLNSAQLVSPLGEPVTRYDKVNLVPFGEFVPWPFNFVADKVSSEVGDFEAGHRVVVSPVGKHQMGAFICYESVFPNFVRKFAAGGAEVLFNLSNDGWFGQSAARPQHLQLVRMRAAENRRWILRSTNDGITAVVDPGGRVRGNLAPNTRTALYANFDYISERTVYTRFGDWFAVLCLIVATLSAVASALPPRGGTLP